MDKEISKYKKGKVGLIPVTWNEKKIGDFAETSSGGTPSRNIKEFYQGGTINWFKTGELISKYIYESEEKITEKAIKETSAKIFPQDTILLAMYGASIGKLSILKKESATNQACCAILPNDNYDTEYLYYQLSFLKNRLIRKSAGAAQPNISQNIIRNFTVPFPSKNEQRKIASILSVWDNAIELKEKLIEQKKELKKGLMQKLLTGEVRLPGFKEEWKKIKLGKLIKELNERSTKNNQYQILSVTKEGIIPQSEHFKKQVASKNNTGYKIVRRNNLVFSTMNLWMGSLDVLTSYDIGIVSPAYKVFRFEEEVFNPIFGKYFMKSEYMIRLYNKNSEQGASIVRRNLDLKGLLNEKILVPPYKEQLEIASILNCIDKEIDLLEKENEQIKKQKKGLMQLLLTGKVRVKV